MDYTTRKAISKATNTMLAGILLIIIGVITLFFKNYSKFPSFEFWGDMLNTIIFMGFGIYSNVTGTKKVNEFKKLGFSIDDTSFSYKKEEENIIYDNKNPLTSILYSSEKIILKNINNEVDEINVGVFYLKYEDLQVLKKQVSDLNSFMQNISKN